MALAYAAEHSDVVRSVTLVGPGLCPKVDVSLREKISIGVNGLVQRRKLYAIPLTAPSLFTANPVMRGFIGGDRLMLREATAGFFVASKRLDFLARGAVRRIAAPVRLLLAGRDRIIDNGATVELLGPVLWPIGGAAEGAARVYPEAHHTLEFEADPREFMDDLAGAVTAGGVGGGSPGDGFRRN